MAREVKAYRCEYSGCMHPTILSKRRMEAHELICFHNEKTRSCATCRFNMFNTCEYQKNYTTGEYELTTNCSEWVSRDSEDPYPVIISSESEGGYDLITCPICHNKWKDKYLRAEGITECEVCNAKLSATEEEPEF